ncbi:MULTISPECIES: hypothetical protein [unclassified Streptomyces]|uniref:hypothetical protein n=1 Tax=unclassified Streptomyces TaxID=2593676 RepID=UPI0004BDFBA1|nr:MULTISPECIES: hypothetical protein [unclassified Streptomyces]
MEFRPWSGAPSTSRTSPATAGCSAGRRCRRGWHGAAAEPWPREADARLARLGATHQALARAWEEARDQQAQAQAEAEPKAATGYVQQQREAARRSLPAEAARLLAERDELWQATARQRAERAAADTVRLEELLQEAARQWAAAALRGFNAVVAAEDPLAVPPAGDGEEEWSEPRLVPPSESGVHTLDDEAGRLYAAAVAPSSRGAPYRRSAAAVCRLRLRNPGRPARSWPCG